MEGRKYDQGKPPMYRGLFASFPRAVAAVATLSGFGASKYAWNNWQDVDDGFARYSDAMVRHLAKEGEGELLDQESGLPHAFSVAWNALARLELLLRENTGDKAAPQQFGLPFERN